MKLVPVDAPWQPHSHGNPKTPRAVIVIRQPEADRVPSTDTPRPDTHTEDQRFWYPFGPAEFHADLLSGLGGAVDQALKGVAHDVDRLSDLRVWFSAYADPMRDADLLAALADLNGVVDEARDEGLEPPSEGGLRNAERLLRNIYALRRCRCEVYPAEDGRVAVDVPGGRGRSVLVLCDSDGSVRCSVNLNGRHRRAVYDAASAADLPDGFVRDALAALDER